MYNEEKKLITDIQRGKDVEANLSEFADVVYKSDFEYACHKFMLNYLTLKDRFTDMSTPEDEYVAYLDTAIDKLAVKYVAGEATVCDETDMKLISELRNTITRKMKVLTAYTDAFEIYEYILNRKEYGFEENMTEELKKTLDGIEVQEFAQNILRFVFSDEDKVAINARLQSVIGQLPLRMTKNRFCDILCDTLDIYNGAEIQNLEDFVSMVMETALIECPDGFDSEYSELKKAYDMISAADYEKLDYDEYVRLAGILDSSASFMESVVTDYMLMIELVNDLYVMMLSLSAKAGVSESCRKAMTIVGEAADPDGEEFEELYTKLDDILGEQESAGEHKLMLEASAYDIQEGFVAEIERAGLADRYKAITAMDKLLSDSMFVDIENVDMPDVLTADAEYIAGKKEKLTDEFMKLFEENSLTVNRAVMAKVLSSIPVFFNTTDEIKEYIENSLSRCRDKGELLAVHSVITQLMES